MALVWKLNVGVMPASESLSDVFMVREFFGKVAFNRLSEQNTQTVSVTNQLLNYIL
jgi:hypothetical protein